MDLEQQVETVNYRADREMEQTQLQVEVAEIITQKADVRRYEAERQAQVIK